MSYTPTPNYGQRMVYDGKRMREKPPNRKTVDFNSSIIEHFIERKFNPNLNRQKRLYLEPHPGYGLMMLPPFAYDDNPISSVTTKYIHTSINKVRCPINTVCWTPEGRRLITGNSTGEFTLWNGLTFNFETIVQAHNCAIRSMVWSNNDAWMVTGDTNGILKYWQPNMNNVKNVLAHKEAVRDISFCSTDHKFATCSDDLDIKVFDFAEAREERVITGHLWDVKCLDWHPYNSLLVSGSKDKSIKLWDARTGNNVETLNGHKNTVVDIEWNKNGNWILSASRDQTIKLFDVRTMTEIQSFRGHSREVTSLAWHPFHEDLFVSGGHDGSMLFWLVGQDDPVGSLVKAHENSVWDLSWHPVGHILVSGSNDHTIKFWGRHRPGEDISESKYLKPLLYTNDEDEEGIMSIEPGLIGSTEKITNLPGLGFMENLGERMGSISYESNRHNRFY